MNKKLNICLLLIITLHISAQTDYRGLLVRDDCTYWATAVSLFGAEEDLVCEGPHLELIQAGILLDKNGYFDWYIITDKNDTIFEKNDQHLRMYISHFTYDLQNDTLFIKSWPKPQTDQTTKIVPCDYAAYKILYLTKEKMLVLGLRKDSNGSWVEDTHSPQQRLTAVEYRYMKPQQNFVR